MRERLDALIEKEQQERAAEKVVKIDKVREIKIYGDTAIEREINALTQLIELSPKRYVSKIAARMVDLLSLQSGDKSLKASEEPTEEFISL